MWKCELCVRGLEVQSVSNSVRSRLDIWALTARSGAMRPNYHHIQRNRCRKFLNKLFTSSMFLCKAMRGYKSLEYWGNKPVVTDLHHTALHSDCSRDNASLKAKAQIIHFFNIILNIFRRLWVNFLPGSLFIQQTAEEPFKHNISPRCWRERRECKRWHAWSHVGGFTPVFQQRRWR